MAEGTSTKSYDGIYKVAVFELLKRKKMEKHCIWSGIVYSDRNGKNNINEKKVPDGEMGVLVPTLFHWS